MSLDNENAQSIGFIEEVSHCPTCKMSRVFRRPPGGLWFCTACGNRLDSNRIQSAYGSKVAAGQYDAQAESSANYYDHVYVPGITSLPSPYNLARGLFIVAGAIVAVVSAFLPWITVQSGFVQLERNGVSNGATDGWIGVAIGGGFLLIEMVYLSRQRNPGRKNGITLLLAGLVLGALAIYDIGDISNRVNNVNSLSGSNFASQGVGVYLFGVAAAMILMGGLWRIIVGADDRRS